MWAEVISADMFATRFGDGAQCMDPAAGMAYRKQVLAVGYGKMKARDWWALTMPQRRRTGVWTTARF